MLDPSTLPTHFTEHPFLSDSDDPDYCAQENRKGYCVFPEAHEIHGGKLTSEAMLNDPRYESFAADYLEVLG